MYLLDTIRSFKDGAVIFELEMNYSSGRIKTRHLYLDGFDSPNLTWHQPTGRFLYNDEAWTANKDLDRFEQWIVETCELSHEEVHVSEWIKHLMKVIILKEQLYRVMHPGKPVRVTGIMRLPEGANEGEAECTFSFPTPPRDPRPSLDDLPF